jgi:hypothetical protein
VISFTVEVTGVEVAISRMDALALRLEQLSGPLSEAGFYLCVKFWDRIVHRPTSPPTYTDRYVAWCIKHGNWGGKLVGILEGYLVGATAPGANPGGQSLKSELESGGSAALVGFLDPGKEKHAHGFNRWHKRRFGTFAINVLPEDINGIRDIFQNWMDKLAMGMNE